MTLVPVDPARPAWIELMGPAGELAGKISETEFVPVRLRKRPAAVMACILSGQEAGIGPMQALRQIFVTDDGKVGMAAELMRSLVLREGHEIWPEDYTTTRVTMAGRRRGNPDANPVRVTWTLDDARKAKLTGRRNWEAYPRAMLTARATTELCRLLFPDVIAGISYSLEELEDGDVEVLPPVEANGAADQPKTVTRKAPASRTRTKKPPAPPSAEPPLPGDAPAGDGMPVAQKIAMRAREAGVDHHLVVSAVTSGTKASAMDLDGSEAAAVLQAISDLAEGRLRVVTLEGASWPSLQEIDAAGDGIEDAEIVEDGPPLPGEEPPAPPRPPVEEWGVDDWRSFLSEKGVRIADVLREAYRLAPDYDTVPPVTLEQLVLRKRLAAVMKDYVDGFGRDEP
ncbi:MAG TPA: hypothetical protein VGP90_11355 [Acidimicrobiia bacterium]|nr:hypothetical protein [Acidimicrobiia bacterium]